ncbi:MAG: permease [Rhodospirillales bacterium]|nr:permease [Alphaproteobacteria bacterium]MCB9987548.1 permease [Rhodospirillales bacterium]USO07730.1 MAG: permease [Rhodospirillales bacterium]
MIEIFTTFANAVTYDLLQADRETPLAEAVHFFVEDTTKIFFLLTSLMLIVGFLRSWVSPEKIRRWLEGKPRMIAYLLALILGAVTPFCSCSSIPLFIAFLSSGIPLGVTMAFLITSPMVNEVAAALFGEMIGWRFTLAYVGVGMMTGMIGGVLIDALKLEKWVEPFVYAAQKTQDGLNALKPTLQKRFRHAWDETADILKRVWRYVLVGVGIGAFIHGFVPQEWFIEHAGADNLLAVPVAVIAAIPLYSNATGIVPVAQVLIAKGLPVGTTLAFIMSTVAISLPELVILRKVLKAQMLAFFVIYLALAFIIVGYGFNWLYQ